MAAYALVWIVLGVVISEACEWKKTGFNLMKNSETDSFSFTPIFMAVKNPF